MSPAGERHHRARALSRAPLDDRLSSLISIATRCHRRRQKLFYASDIAEFEKYRYELDDAIKAGDVAPAFVMFRRYQQRSRERMNYAIELLARSRISTSTSH